VTLKVHKEQKGMIHKREQLQLVKKKNSPNFFQIVFSVFAVDGGENSHIEIFMDFYGRRCFIHMSQRCFF